MLARDGSPDLVGGKRTLPVVHALSTLATDERARLERLLDDARHSSDAHAAVREVLVSSGSVHYTALAVGVYASRARRALAAARPPPGPQRELEAIIGRMHARGVA